MGAVGTSAKQSDEYAETQSNHQRSYSDLGKGVPLNTLPRQRPLYIVEFKAGRTDIYYTAENSSLVCRVGDLVIVEADRGKDLGKVINDSVTPKQLELLQQNQAGDSGSGDSRLGNKEIQPKLIYHIAQPSEIAQLAAKSQDEAKAMLVCQTKVRQKKLPMEVMDAEYQWDRRKLTFYFIAQRRIDFRELVRDLFKIYKTRIWMCAMNTNPITSLLRSAESPSQSVADADKE
ncbi:PSP1-domain-containing protein [Basidiobolus meristosporus CBS 931.73]|uniref:PSP1-domain-containing protein n=1 Tax=Basidiobolus meristosporus CBS 931.73 TaxID=1314790 RepID=A0A1Y1XZV0_9FUNG|nr:PSP1-domain-containing protein [Basidiobolus meristosporus CBS 931.73]|eukprot:ORX91283.1 PSP1-domain-containing protein [Basidiobolus meristosporus CBS 931.73]